MPLFTALELASNQHLKDDEASHLSDRSRLASKGAIADRLSFRPKINRISGMSCLRSNSIFDDASTDATGVVIVFGGRHLEWH